MAPPSLPGCTHDTSRKLSSQYRVKKADRSRSRSPTVRDGRKPVRNGLRRATRQSSSAIEQPCLPVRNFVADLIPEEFRWSERSADPICLLDALKPDHIVYIEAFVSSIRGQWASHAKDCQGQKFVRGFLQFDKRQRVYDINKSIDSDHTEKAFEALLQQIQGTKGSNCATAPDGRMKEDQRKGDRDDDGPGEDCQDYRRLLNYALFGLDDKKQQAERAPC